MGSGAQAGTDSPVNPSSAPSPVRSTAHSAYPSLAQWAVIRSMNASLSARDRGADSHRATSGSAFMAANGSRSASPHPRRWSRAVRRRGTAGDSGLSGMVLTPAWSPIRALSCRR